MKNIVPKIEESWKKVLMSQFESDYFQQLKSFLINEKQENIVYPPGGDIFSAFDSTPFHSVKVVILGQDPYHGQGQANGLCFSVNKGVRIPPSLANIFKEIKDDMGYDANFDHGDLQFWAQQGVLLLNTTLTVRAHKPLSHRDKGWERFTDFVIGQLSAHHTGLVFLLWGKHAQTKIGLIDNTKHHLLISPHPSPFSAFSGFFGCKHFSKTNELLCKEGKSAIDWRL